MSERERTGGGAGCALAAGVAAAVLLVLGAGVTLVFLRLRRAEEARQAEAAASARAREALDELARQDVERQRKREQAREDARSARWKAVGGRLEELGDLLDRGLRLRLERGPLAPEALEALPVAAELHAAHRTRGEEPVVGRGTLRLTGGASQPLRAGWRLATGVEEEVRPEGRIEFGGGAFLPAATLRPLDPAAETVEVPGPGGPRGVVLRAPFLGSNGQPREGTLEVWVAPGRLTPLRIALRGEWGELSLELTLEAV